MRTPELRDCFVHFRVQDLRWPDPAIALRELYGQKLLQGRVLELSGGGTNDELYAVIEVEGMKQPVIVAVQCILGTVE